MKFTQLKIGERFYYKNASYTKTGPIQATEDGSTNPQMIMRSAIVQTSAGEKEADPSGDKPMDRLRQTLGVYHSECKAILLETDISSKTDALDRLEIRYQELLQALNKT